MATNKVMEKLDTAGHDREGETENGSTIFKFYSPCSIGVAGPTMSGVYICNITLNKKYYKSGDMKW
jgi:hypothetical protein